MNSDVMYPNPWVRVAYRKKMPQFLQGNRQKLQYAFNIMRLFIVLNLLTQVLFAQNTNNTRVKRSLYEIGAGGFYSKLPDYPASENYRARWLVLPFARYRGENFRSDDEGTRAIFNHSEKLKFEFSFGGNFPATSKGNKTRKGMDDLELLFEVGPRIAYEFYQDETGRVRIQFPIRGAVATNLNFLELDFYAKRQGHVWGPEFQFEKIFNPTWEFNYWLSLNYLDEGYSDYFYEVRQKDATQNRNAYNAKGGFLGFDHSAGFLFRTKNLRWFMGIRYSDYREAQMKDSPLFKNAENNVVFTGMTYIFHRSKKLEK